MGGGFIVLVRNEFIGLSFRSLMVKVNLWRGVLKIFGVVCWFNLIIYRNK